MNEAQTKGMQEMDSGEGRFGSRVRDDKLSFLATALLKPQLPFECGARVKWKEGLANQLIEGEMVVTSLVLNQDMTPGQYGLVNSAERFDITVAFLGAKGGLEEAYIDSRRLCLSQRDTEAAESNSKTEAPADTSKTEEGRISIKDMIEMLMSMGIAKAIRIGGCSDPDCPICITARYDKKDH